MARATKWLRVCGVIASGLLMGCEPDPRFMPVCEFGTMETQRDVFVINGEPDAGLKVLVTVKNIGQTGPLRVTTRLGTSEGDWTRTRSIRLNANETRIIRFDFPEPTINASNIETVVECGWG